MAITVLPRAAVPAHFEKGRWVMQTQTHMDDAAPVVKEKKTVLVDWTTQHTCGYSLPAGERAALSSDDLLEAIDESGLFLIRDPDGKLSVVDETRCEDGLIDTTTISMTDADYAAVLAAERAGDMKTASAIIHAAEEKDAAND